MTPFSVRIPISAEEEAAAIARDPRNAGIINELRRLHALDSAAIVALARSQRRYRGQWRGYPVCLPDPLVPWVASDWRIAGYVPKIESWLIRHHVEPRHRVLPYARVQAGLDALVVMTHCLMFETAELAEKFAAEVLAGIA